MSVSEFMRRALIDRLRWHGLDPALPAAGDTNHQAAE
jgi:hypothetical protein